MVRVKFQDRAQLKRCWAKDISRGGIYLRTRTPLDPFEKLTVILELPGDRRIDLRGEVVHTVRAERAKEGVDPGMGVQFIDLTPEKRLLLEQCIEAAQTLRPTSPSPPAPAAPALEELIHALRRLLWLCGDARALADKDSREVLGLSPKAGTEDIRAACDVLRALLDPKNPPPGAERWSTAGISGLLRVVSDMEHSLDEAGGRPDAETTSGPKPSSGRGP